MLQIGRTTHDNDENVPKRELYARSAWQRAISGVLWAVVGYSCKPPGAFRRFIFLKGDALWKP